MKNHFIKLIMQGAGVGLLFFCYKARKDDQNALKAQEIREYAFRHVDK